MQQHDLQHSAPPAGSNTTAYVAAAISGCLVLVLMVCTGVLGVLVAVELRDRKAVLHDDAVADLLDEEEAQDDPEDEAFEAEPDEEEDLAEEEGPEDAPTASDEPQASGSRASRRPRPAPPPPPPIEEKFDLVVPAPEPPPKPKARAPDPGKGAVQFEIAVGDAANVYASGDLVASMSPNRSEVFVNLPPGSHKVVIKDVASSKVLYKGTLEITEGRVVRVAFGRMREPVQLYGPPDSWRSK